MNKCKKIKIVFVIILAFTLTACSFQKGETQPSDNEKKQVEKSQNVNIDIKMGSYETSEAAVGQMCEFTIDKNGKLTSRYKTDSMTSVMESEKIYSYEIEGKMLFLKDAFGNVENEFEIIDEGSLKGDGLTYKYKEESISKYNN